VRHSGKAAAGVSVAVSLQLSQLLPEKGRNIRCSSN